MKQRLHTLPADGPPAQPLWRNRDFLLASSARFAATAGLGAVVVSVMLQLQNVAAAGPTPAAGPWLVAAYLLCSALPLVLLAPWAGRAGGHPGLPHAGHGGVHCQRRGRRRNGPWHAV